MLEPVLEEDESNAEEGTGRPGGRHIRAKHDDEEAFRAGRA